MRRFLAFLHDEKYRPTMLGLSASITADDVCIRCRVRRSPYALNPEYDDEVEMQCTLRSWNENGKDAAVSGSGGKGVTSQWLAQQQEQQQHSSNGDLLVDGTSQHQAGPEIIFKPVHSHSTVVVRHESTGSVGKGGGIDGNGGVGGSNGESLMNQRFSHIRTRSGSTGRSPVVGRPPVASIDRKNLIPAGDGTGSNPGSRSSSRSRSRLRSRSGSRAGSRGRAGSSAAALDLFDAGSLNDSDISVGRMAGSGGGSATDSPYNSDGEGGSAAGSLSPNGAGTLSVPLPNPPPSYRILASDIIVVDVAAERDSNVPATERSKKIYLTTISSGYFECSFDSFNSHSVMVAFLKAVLPSERLNRTGDHQTKNQETFATAASCCTTDIRESYDMENFTAREMKETVERESLFAKLRRRITHIAGQCGDLSAQLSDTVCGGQSVDAYAETRSVDYSTGAFDSTITTPVHNNKPVVQLDESAVLPDKPEISFEATPSRDDQDRTGFNVKDQILNNGDLRPTLNLKESSVEQMMFSKRANAESDGILDPVGLNRNANDAVAPIQPTEEETEGQTCDRSPEDAGGGMMQSVDI